MKNFFIALLVGVAFLSACSKNKKTAEEIEGTWLEIKVDDTTIPDASADKIWFGACKNRKKEKCDCHVTDAGSTEPTEFYYLIDDKGKTLIVKDYAGIFEVEVKVDILTLEENRMVLDWGSYIGEYKRI